MYTKAYKMTVSEADRRKRSLGLHIKDEIIYLSKDCVVIYLKVNYLLDSSIFDTSTNLIESNFGAKKASNFPEC